MIADLLRSLAHASLGLTVALVLVFVLRAPARRAGGAFLAYVLWAIVPLALAVSLLPPPRVVITAESASLSLGLPSSTTPAAFAAAATPLSAAWWLLPWALGVGVCFALLAWQQRRFVRSMGALRPLDAQAWLAERGDGCPAVVGLLPPRLVLPHDFTERYSAQERELILAHERVHLARGDAYANAAAALLRCVFWFHPLMHLAVARFRQDQELACDAVVLRHFPRARRAYADAMLKTQLADLGLPVGCHWQSSQPLRERILMLKNPLPGLARRAVGVAVIAALALGGSYAAWATQPAQMIAAAGASTGKFVDAKFDVRIDNGDPHSVRVISPLGESFSVRDDAGGHGPTWDGQFIATANGPGQIVLDGVLRQDGKVVSRPKLILKDGVAGGMKVGEANGQSFRGLDMQITLARADAPTPRPPAAAADSGVSYRSLKPPAWPADVKGPQGVVVLRVLVGTGGEAKDVKVEGTTPGAEAFNSTALAAVKTWTFEPAHKGGKAVESSVRVPLRFGDKGALEPTLASDGTPALDEIYLKAPEASADSANRPAMEDMSFRATDPPVYPAEAIQAGLGGKVVLKVQVFPDGMPGTVELASVDVYASPKDSPPKKDITEQQRKEAAEKMVTLSKDAVKRWRFNPAMKDGKPVEAWSLVPVEFSLTDS